ncbi:hypothetical protein GUJ93_ZPchr0001g30917 [Zizania palustris]|uniref:Uncharacterized protein n=1 Tax=Zizania palustris TaxID=103762 RepID=A0A8J5RDQ4_ZIZPA|nr:hypothetical protein GUJ93_ZPchr0001g30917 [Zizania palustris]
MKKEQGTRFLQLPLARDFAHAGAILLGPWEVVRPVDVAGGQVEAVGGDSKMNTLIWYGWLGGVIIGTMIGVNTVLEAHCKVRPHNIVITGSTRGLGKPLAHSPESFLQAINELEENMWEGLLIAKKKHRETLLNAKVGKCNTPSTISAQQSEDIVSARNAWAVLVCVDFEADEDGLTTRQLVMIVHLSLDLVGRWMKGHEAGTTLMASREDKEERKLVASGRTARGERQRNCGKSLEFQFG